jgi:tetrathionate reductase subunit B
VPKVQVTYHHSICQHCADAPCIAACKQNAIYRRDDGIVIIDPDKCRGNQTCIAACPYPGVIYFNDDLNIAQKCTFCAHLIDQGWTETRCSDACPTGAFTFGEEEDLKDLIEKAQPLRLDLPTKPRVYYIGLPKKWIAGEVYDPIDDECAEGATVTATNLATGESYGSQTDRYGDFWIKGLPDGSYSMKIEKAGYAAQTLASVDATQKDVNVGTIALTRS